MEPHWTAYVTAFATPVVAVLGLWIAYRQWATARDKLRLDLFERRMAIYDAFRKILGRIGHQAWVSQDDIVQYLIDVSGAKWLFEQEVADYLENEVHENLTALLSCTMALSGNLSDEERAHRAQQEGNVLRRFSAQRARGDQLFMPYLGFRHRTGTIRELWSRQLTKLRRR